jgi:hypothetical protein
VLVFNNIYGIITHALNTQVRAPTKALVRIATTQMRFASCFVRTAEAHV